MNDNQFDHIVKSNLEQYASKFPDDMWERIKHKDKKRRIIFVPWRYFLVLLLAAGSLTTGYFLLNKKTVSTQNNLAPASKNNESDLSSDKDVGAVNLQKGAITNNDLNVPPVHSIQQAKFNQQTKQFFDNTSKIELSWSKSQEEKIVPSENSEPHKNANPDSNPRQEISSGKKEETPQKKLSLSIDSESEEEKQDDEEPERFAIEFYVSPDLPFGKFSSSYGNYEQEKNSSTNFRLSYTLGARINMLVTNHIVARSGLQYSVINEKFIATDSVMDSKTSNNHYKSIDIPLLLAYYTEKKDFAAMFSTGIVLNLNSSYEGYLPAADGSIVNLGSSKMYKSNTGVSLYFGAAFSKQLNKNTDLFAEPYLKYRLNNMAGGFEPFTQKINTAGISLGIRYRFFKNPE